MAYHIILQKSLHNYHIPKVSDFKKWILPVLKSQVKAAEITIRIVNEAEGKALNDAYRKKQYATNILSFSYELTDELVMGDLIMCLPVIEREATEQNKKLESHWAHLSIHGILHLLGYDHQREQDAKQMKSLEIKFIKQLGFDNPYQ